MAAAERIQLPSEGLGSAAPMPFANPGAFGASVIGGAIAGAGADLHESQERADRAEKQRQEESANAAAAPGAAQLSLDLSRAAQAARDEAPLDGAGHVERVTEEADALVGKYLQSIPDERVRLRWTARAAEISGNQIGDEDGWARGRRLAAIGSNANDARKLWGNQLQGNPDPHAFDQALKSGETFWNGVTAPADIKAKGLREWNADTTEDYATGWIEKDPAIALAQLKSGALDDWLDPDKKRVLVDRAETGIRIAAADMRRQQAQVQQQAREDVGEFKQRIDRGEVPSDKEFATLTATAKSADLPELVDDLGYMQGKIRVSKETDKWTSADWEHNVNALAAKVAGGKSSAEEQMQLKLLQDLRPAKEARFKSDPEGFASASGIPAPQVDLANPDAGAVNARKAWARSFARTGGLIEPPYLSKDQLQVYRDRAAQGPIGQLEAATELKQTWGADAAPSIIRQIGGDAKGDMLIMLGLNPRMAQVYRRGTEALTKKAVKFNDDAARTVWADYANAVPPDVRPALFDAARNIAAGWMSEQGKTEPTADFAEVMRQAVHRAGGMLGSAGEGSATGGFVRWNGRYAWLPPEMSRDDFQKRISRASPRDWVNAAVDPAGNPANAVPHHLGSDGKPKPYTLGEAQRFGTGTLQTVAPGIFRLIDRAGNAVVDGQGRPWQFDVRRLDSGFDAQLAAHGYVRR